MPILGTNTVMCNIAGDVKRVDCPQNSWKGVSGMGEQPVRNAELGSTHSANCTQCKLI